MRQNYLTYILFAIALSPFISCNNEYDYPDVSNARPSYHVDNIPSDVCKKWVGDAKQYGLSFEVAGEKWESVVEELDANGNILYSGVNRGLADKDAKALKVGFICKQRVSTIDDNYYDVCTFWLDKSFKLEISPKVNEVSVNSTDNYTIKEPDASRRIYRYNITSDNSISMLRINTEDSLGYQLSRTKLSIIEKDKNGEVIYNGSPGIHPSGGYISHVGATEIIPITDFYGWPKKTYNNEVKVGTITFQPFTLSPNIDIVLSTSNVYTIELIPEEQRSTPYYVNYDNSISMLMTNTCESLGYERSSTKLSVIEKDKNGEVLTTKTVSRVIDMQTSAVGATEIIPIIDFYGRPKGTSNNEVKVGTITFQPFTLSPNIDIVISTSNEYTLQTYL